MTSKLRQARKQIAATRARLEELDALCVELIRRQALETFIRRLDARLGPKRTEAVAAQD